MIELYFYGYLIWCVNGVVDAVRYKNYFALPMVLGLGVIWPFVLCQVIYEYCTGRGEK